MVRMFARNRHRLPLAAVLGLATVFILVFQNCADVKVMRTPLPTTIVQKVSAYASVQGRYCTQIASLPAAIRKVVLVMDLSLSNVGAYSGGGVFQNALGTDPTSARFQALSDFVTNCDPTIEYAVVAFASNRIFAAGGDSCTMNFTDGVGAVQRLNALKAQERANLATVLADAPGVAHPELQTSYEQGLTCARDLVGADLDRAVKKSDVAYTVLFVTDGAPTVDATCPSMATCAHDQLNQTRSAQIVNTALAFGGTARVQPIFYGTLFTQDAEKIMGAIANAGRVASYLKVNELKNIDFCGLVNNPTPVKYTKSSFLAIPLTAKPVEGGWAADGDMDGIPDALESSLGFDSTKRRTAGILDSICQTMGSKDACRTFASSCSQQLNNFGLTKCDLKALGFNDTTSIDAGVDTDTDGLPDLIELLRGTEPALIDAALDHDGDGITNFTEIRRGSVADLPDAVRERDKMLNVTESRSSDQTGCPDGQEVWAFHIDQIPLIEVGASGDDASLIHMPAQALPRKELSLVHAADEHLIYVGYHATAVSGAALPSQTWGTIVRIDRKTYDGRPIEVRPADFTLVGENK